MHIIYQQNTTGFQSGVLQFIVCLKATSEDLEQLKKLFIKLDTSKDGFIQVEELRDGMKELLKYLQDDVSAYNELMEGLDQDGNGVIDYSEFITGAIDKQAMLQKGNLKNAFDLIDSDNSGAITINELKNAFDSNETKDESLWKEIMLEVDKNRDNKITFDEFIDAMTGFLKEKHSMKKQNSKGSNK